MGLVVSGDLPSWTHVSPFSPPFLGGAEGGGQLDVRSLEGEGLLPSHPLGGIWGSSTSIPKGVLMGGSWWEAEEG